jgi:hypothetical protein
MSQYSIIAWMAALISLNLLKSRTILYRSSYLLSHRHLLFSISSSISCISSISSVSSISSTSPTSLTSSTLPC